MRSCTFQYTRSSSREICISEFIIHETEAMSILILERREFLAPSEIEGLSQKYGTQQNANKDVKDKYSLG